MSLIPVIKSSNIFVVLKPRVKLVIFFSLLQNRQRPSCRYSLGWKIFDGAFCDFQEEDLQILGRYRTSHTFQINKRAMDGPCSHRTLLKAFKSEYQQNYFRWRMINIARILCIGHMGMIPIPIIKNQNKFRHTIIHLCFLSGRLSLAALKRENFSLGLHATFKDRRSLGLLWLHDRPIRFR